MVPTPSGACHSDQPDNPGPGRVSARRETGTYASVSRRVRSVMVMVMG